MAYLSLSHKAGGGPEPPMRNPFTRVWAKRGPPTMSLPTSVSKGVMETHSHLSVPLPQVVLPKKGFLPIGIRERKEKLYFSLFIALKHLLLGYVLLGDLAFHIHKQAALGLIVQLTQAIKWDPWRPGKVFEGEVKEPPGLFCFRR